MIGLSCKVKDLGIKWYIGLGSKDLVIKFVLSLLGRLRVDKIN